MSDSCISGVKLVRGKTRSCPLRGAVAASIASLPKAIKRIQDTLASGTRAGLDKLVTFPFELDDAANFSMGGTAVKYTSWKARAAGCKPPRDAINVLCPGPVWMSDDEDRPGELREIADDTVALIWPSSREVLPVWNLRWTGAAGDSLRRPRGCGE